MKAWTLNSPTQSPGDLQHSWEQTKDVGVADALTDNVQRKDKDEESHNCHRCMIAREVVDTS